MQSHQASYAQKRRSTRIDQNVNVIVQGVGALREPYQEQVSTLSISCHGCTYQSKHEVIQGETVYLDVITSSEGSVACSTKGRVKWAQKVGVKERIFQIAVELEIAGNIWGIPTPPADWFPPQLPPINEAAAPTPTLKVVARKEQQAIALTTVEASSRAAGVEKREPLAPSIPALAQLMMGLGEQIQTVASEAATATLFKEKSRLIEEFRTQFREEASKGMQSAIATAKELIVRQASKEMSEAHQTIAQNTHAQWAKKIEQELEAAQHHILKQEKETTTRLDGLAAATIERVQRSMEITRTDLVDRFVTRLRDQVEPLLVEAKNSLQKLEASEAAIKKESEIIYSGFGNQLEQSAQSSLSKAQQDLEKNTFAVAARTNETLQKLYQDFEKAAQSSAESLLASSGNQITEILQGKVNEISQSFSAGLENHTRNYLESVGKSIAEIPNKIPNPSR
ncbi:MAG TPA: hypothetical protein VG272_06605 [Candidatus Acidoferrales bacterium]|nr:hypothetical protein [Candidatus Acidoferrales bacterium]